MAQASSFLNYIAEEAFKDRFVQQSQKLIKTKTNKKIKIYKTIT
ncbi:hypothetical protein [Acinetobacter baumannii]